MSTFQVAVGHDQEGSLAAVSPQPRSSGLRYIERVTAIDGSLTLKGLPYVEWIWDYLSYTDYGTLLTACGLDATAPTASAEVTIKTLENDYATWSNFNAIAHLPEVEVDIDRDRGTTLNVVMRFIGLVAT